MNTLILALLFATTPLSAEPRQDFIKSQDQIEKILKTDQNLESTFRHILLQKQSINPFAWFSDIFNLFFDEETNERNIDLSDNILFSSLSKLTNIALFIPNKIIEKLLGETILYPAWFILSHDQKVKLMVDHSLKIFLSKKDQIRYIVPKYIQCLETGKDEKSCEEFIQSLKKKIETIVDQKIYYVTDVNDFIIFPKNIRDIFSIIFVQNILRSQLVVDRKNLTREQLHSIEIHTKEILRDYKVCIARKSRTEFDLSTCDHKFSRSFPLRIARALLSMRLEENLQCRASREFYTKMREHVKHLQNQCLLSVHRKHLERPLDDIFTPKESIEIISGCTIAPLLSAIEMTFRFNIKKMMDQKLSKATPREKKILLDHSMELFRSCYTDKNMEDDLEKIQEILNDCSKDISKRTGTRIMRLIVLEDDRLNEHFGEDEKYRILHRASGVHYRHCLEYYGTDAPQKCHSLVTSSLTHEAIKKELSLKMVDLPEKKDLMQTFNSCYDDLISEEFISLKTERSTLINSESCLQKGPSCKGFIADKSCDLRPYQIEESSYLSCFTSTLEKVFSRMAIQLLKKQISRSNVVKNFSPRKLSYKKWEEQAKNCFRKHLTCTTKDLRSNSPNLCERERNTLASIRTKLPLIAKVCKKHLTRSALSTIISSLVDIQLDKMLKDDSVERINREISRLSRVQDPWREERKKFLIHLKKEKISEDRRFKLQVHRRVKHLLKNQTEDDDQLYFLLSKVILRMIVEKKLAALKFLSSSKKKLFLKSYFTQTFYQKLQEASTSSQKNFHTFLNFMEDDLTRKLGSLMIEETIDHFLEERLKEDLYLTSKKQFYNCLQMNSRRKCSFLLKEELSVNIFDRIVTDKILNTPLLSSKIDYFLFNIKDSLLKKHIIPIKDKSIDSIKSCMAQRDNSLSVDREERLIDLCLGIGYLEMMENILNFSDLYMMHFAPLRDINFFFLNYKIIYKNISKCYEKIKVSLDIERMISDRWNSRLIIDKVDRCNDALVEEILSFEQS